MGQPSSLKWPGESPELSQHLEATETVSLAPGHSREPDETPENTAYYRQRAESFGDLALDMIGEGLEGTAYGAARKAAHYGRIAEELYRQRAEELMRAHPEWFK